MRRFLLLSALFLSAATAIQALPRIHTQAAPAATPAKAPASAATELWGFMRNTVGYDTPGIYSFTAESDLSLEAVSIDDFDPDMYGYNAEGGSVFQDGKFYFVELFTFNEMVQPVYHVYDTKSWTSDNRDGESLTNYGLVAKAVTYDATTDLSYGMFLADYGYDYVFASVDYRTKKRTELGAIYANYTAFAAGNDGKLYAIASDNNLYEVNKADGALTLIGATGVDAESSTHVQSATISKRTGEMFWAAVTTDGTSALYSVNTETGKATKISDFPEGVEMSCLYVVGEDDAEGLPGKATDLTANFADGSTIGTIDFKMPTKDAAGNTLTGSYTYYITNGTDTLSTGKAEAGESVSRRLALVEGSYRFLVTVASSVGSSPATAVEQYVGVDTPKGPKNVKLVIDETGHATLTWDAVTEGQNGGYIGDITYAVTRYPDSVQVSTTNTTLSEQFETGVLKAYQYGIRAVNSKGQSYEVHSNGASVGKYYETPWLEGFDTRAAFNLWTVVDNNKDGSTWSYFEAYLMSNSFAQSDWNYSDDADDWLISPAVHMKPGTYEVSFKAKSIVANHPERLAVAWGNDTTVAAMTNVLWEPITLDDSENFTTFTKEITVTEEGLYHFGFHAVSEKGNYRIQLDNISVALKESSGIRLTSDDANAEQPVYDINGRHLKNVTSKDLNTLQRGIYIVGGKKVIVR